jgi:hypothetical protein
MPRRAVISVDVGMTPASDDDQQRGGTVLLFDEGSAAINEHAER